MKTLKKALSLLMALAVICTIPLSASAANVSGATIDLTKTGSVNLYKYDLTGAEKDGVWDSSYVSTGVRDESGVEAILGNPSRVSSLNANGTAYGYAVPGVEFTYLKVADIRAFSITENGAEHVEVLYGIKPTENTNAFLSAIGLSTDDRYAPADTQEDGQTVYYYQSDKLIAGLQSALSANSTVVKNKLEKYVHDNSGTAMAVTNAYGHSAASNLPLGLYLFVETRVPEMVVDTTDPFLLSLPMTTVTGSNANTGGEAWNYDITIYPKNITGIPSLEKTLREAVIDTGKNNGSTSDITDGYAHTASASSGDLLDYQIISTLPSITSAASYITEYTFVDTLAAGLSYKKNDVLLEFFKDAGCTDHITSWADNSGKFTVAYNTAADGKNVMTISLTAAGLTELNTSAAVYSGASMVNSGFSDCTLRVTYQAKLNSDSTVVFGDSGNSNAVALQWKRTNSDFYDTLVDDCHAYVYGVDVTKRFSDGQGDMSKVEFVVYNNTDKYFLVAALNASEGVWYVTGHTQEEASATHFSPNSAGKLMIKGMEDDNYVFSEVKTANGYSLLKDNIRVSIVPSESTTVCDIYATDALGLIQNDPRFANVSPGVYHNMPQKHLEHKTLTAAAAVDGNRVSMGKDGNSDNAFVLFNVVNTKGFDLPQTGSRGNWMFPVIGISGLSLALLGIVLLSRKKTAQD
jgi:fimbrial isopeptide formation D2 family protein/LPXTG-motif cell wall-anchored protein